MCICQLQPKTDLHIINAKKIPIKLLLKQYPVATSLEHLFPECAKDFYARKKANQSK